MHRSSIYSFRSKRGGIFMHRSSIFSAANAEEFSCSGPAHIPQHLRRNIYAQLQHLSIPQQTRRNIYAQVQHIFRSKRGGIFMHWSSIYSAAYTEEYFCIGPAYIPKQVRDSLANYLDLLRWIKVLVRTCRDCRLNSANGSLSFNLLIKLLKGQGLQI